MYRTLLVIGLLLATQAGVSQSKKKALDDATLDRVTAAGVTTQVLARWRHQFHGRGSDSERPCTGLDPLWFTGSQLHEHHHNGDHESGRKRTAEL